MINRAMLEELILAPGVAGNEEVVRDIIQNHIMEFVNEININEIGNLSTVNRFGSGSHIAIVTNMDEIGLIVTNIDEKGFLKFSKIGCIDDRQLLSRHVELHLPMNKTVRGVIGVTPGYLMPETIRSSTLEQIIPSHEMFIDIGASSREDIDEIGIKIGTTITFVKELSYLANNKLASSSLDNRVGCFVLMELIKELSKTSINGTMTSVFTTQNKSGSSHPTAAPYFTECPDMIFTIDMISAPDHPGVHDLYKNQFRLGYGPVVRKHGIGVTSNEKNDIKFDQASQISGIPTQLATVSCCTNHASIQCCGDAINMASICIPCRYTNSAGEIISLYDIDSTIRFMAEAVKIYCN